jgi:protein TonB
MTDKIVDIIFQKRTPPPLRRSTFAALFAFGLHVGILLWALSLPPKPVLPKPKEYIVEMEKPKPPLPPPPKPPAPPPPTTPAPVAPAPVKPQPVVKAPTTPLPAQAAKIIAAEPDPIAPVDLSDAFVTGNADTYAGGVTTTNGTNDKAVPTTETAPNTTPPPKPQRPNRSRLVSLDEDNWSCSWPKAADEEQIDEQSVIIKVSVDAKGKVSSASIVSDPGHGFGAAAAACALKTRFTPALDPEGKAIAALSPPIRVRFTR